MSKVNDLKQENEIKIRECLYDGQIWTKNDLAYKTSLSLATTTNILQEMLKSREIEYVSDSKSTGGRKSKEYQLYKDYKHLLKIVLKKNKKSYEFIFEIIDLYDQIVYQKNYSSLKGTVEEFLKIIRQECIKLFPISWLPVVSVWWHPAIPSSMFIRMMCKSTAIEI